MLTSRSGWQVEGDSVYRFGAIRADNVVLDLTRYRFDEERLVEATYARRANWNDGAWQLEDVATTRIFDDHTESEQADTQRWETDFTPCSWSACCVRWKARHPVNYGLTPASWKVRACRRTNRCCISGKKCSCR